MEEREVVECHMGQEVEVSLVHSASSDLVVTEEWKSLQMNSKKFKASPVIVSLTFNNQEWLCCQNLQVS